MDWGTGAGACPAVWINFCLLSRTAFGSMSPARNPGIVGVNQGQMQCLRSLEYAGTRPHAAAMSLASARKTILFVHLKPLFVHFPLADPSGPISQS